jgi:hypothetical protein
MKHFGWGGRNTAVDSSFHAPVGRLTRESGAGVVPEICTKKKKIRAAHAKEKQQIQ